MKKAVVTLVALLLLAGAGCTSQNYSKSESNSGDKPTTTAGNVDNRVVLHPVTATEGMDSYDVPSDKSVCDQVLKFDSTNEQVVYSNFDQGIKISLPYNSSWGNGNFKVPAYDENAKGVDFGPLNIDLLNSTKRSCEWQRLLRLSFEPFRTVEKAIQVVKSYGKTVAIQPVSYNINGLSVIKYRNLFAQNELSRGWCVLEIVGKKANYRLYTRCSNEPSKEFSQLEDIAKTITLTE